jgi:hypothetical protein
MHKINSVKLLIEKAIGMPENRNPDGSINWCFVDADIHIWNDTWKLGFTDDELHIGLAHYEC